MNSKSNDLMKVFGNRSAIEGSVIMSMFKDCDLFDQYKLKDKDFLTEEGKLLFKIGSLIHNKGIEQIDLTTLQLELEHHPELKDDLQKFGGAKTVIKQLAYVNENNIDLYFDELLKNNYLTDLCNKGFNVTKYANDLKSMNYMQVKDWVEYQLISSDVNTDTICRNIKVNFFDLTDEDIEDMDSGTYIETVSFHQYCPILNNVFNGLPLGTTTMISAPSGRGKSTFTMSNLIYPIIRDGEKAIVISNELTYKQYQAMLLSIIAVREFGYYGLTREKINKSRLKDEDKEIRQKIQSFIRENKLNERLVFVDYESADISVVKKMMKKYSKLGFNVAFFDTFKASDSSDGRAWGKIIEDAKQLTFTAKETNQALVITYQVAPHAENKYSMSRADLAEGKSLITVITNHFIFRPVKNDEYSKEKHDLHCYKLKRNEITQKWEKVPFELKNDGSYYIVGTIDKTRFSGDSRSIVYKFLGTWGIYEELCYAIPSTDVDYRK